MTSEGVITRHEVTNQGHSWWGAQLTHGKESLHISGYLSPQVYPVGNTMKHQVPLAFLHMRAAEQDYPTPEAYTSNRRPSVGPVVVFPLGGHAELVSKVGEPMAQLMMPGFNKPATHILPGRYRSPVTIRGSDVSTIAQQWALIAPDIPRAALVSKVGEPIAQLMPGFNKPATHILPGRYRSPVTIRDWGGIAIAVAQQGAHVAPDIPPEKPEPYAEDPYRAISHYLAANFATTRSSTDTKFRLWPADCEALPEERPTALSWQVRDDVESAMEKQLQRYMERWSSGNILLIRSTDDVVPNYPIVESFSKGFGGISPSDDTIETASMIVDEATRMVSEREIEVDETDGALSFELRLKNRYLVIGELSVEGDLHANVYNDEDPNPNAGIEDIWVRHLPKVSAAALIAWF